MKGLVELLEKRSKDFLIDAEIDLKEGRYELAAFHLEQGLQLKLKAEMLKFGVQFPKTYSIRELLSILSKLRKDKKLMTSLNRKKL